MDNDGSRRLSVREFQLQRRQDGHGPGVTWNDDLIRVHRSERSAVVEGR